MRISDLDRCLIDVFAAVGIFAGCAGQTPLGPPNPMLTVPDSHEAGTATVASVKQSSANREDSRYTLDDVGTFGGPQSGVPSFPPETLNSAGTFAGWADTSAPDPFPSFCFDALFRFIAPDCNVADAFEWEMVRYAIGGPLSSLRSRYA